MGQPVTFAGHEPGSRAYARISGSMFAAGFATFIGVFDAQAALPAVSRDFGITASAASLTVSATTLGIAAAVLPWAWLADRIGRVRAMRISLLAATVLAFAVPLLPTFPAVVAARALVGVALGAVPAVSMAYLAEEIVRRRVSIAAGVFVAGNTLGGIVGRLVAGPLSELIGWRGAFAVVSVIGTGAMVAFLLLVPPARGFVPHAPQPYPLRTRILFPLRDPVMLGLYAQGFLLMGAFAAVYNYLPYRLTGTPFDIPEVWVSSLFVAYLAGTAASRASAVLATRIGHLRVILGGIAVMAVGLALMLTGALAVVLAGLVLFTVGCFSAHPTASGLSGQLARFGRAQATALYQLAWLGGTSLFGWLVGLVFDRSGWPAATSVLLAMVGISAAAAVLGLRWRAAHRPAPPAVPIAGPTAG